MTFQNSNNFWKDTKREEEEIREPKKKFVLALPWFFWLLPSLELVLVPQYGCIEATLLSAAILTVYVLSLFFTHSISIVKWKNRFGIKVAPSPDFSSHWLFDLGQVILAHLTGSLWASVFSYIYIKHTTIFLQKLLLRLNK